MLFDRMPQDRMTQAYRSYSELGLATLAVQRNDFQAPLESISRLRSQIDPSAHFLLALSFHTTAGTLYLRQGDAARAEQDFQSGLRLAQRALASIQGDSDRLRWQVEMAELYRGLVRIRLDRHDPRGALATWLEFRGASIDPGKLASHSLLVYTQFPDGLAAWLADDRGVSYHWTSIRAEDLQQAVEQYAGLCADPGAAPALLRAPAERLYRWLVQPFAERLQPSRTLLISTDGMVGRLPLQTLFDDRFAVASVPGAITPGGGERFTRDAHALVVAAPALPAAAAMFPPLPDAAREGSSVAARFLHPTVLAGTAAVLPAVLQRMPDAEIFHFAGHAMIAAAEPGLVLAARQGDSPEVLGAGSLAPGILRRCRLAVLSACGSAAGESDLVLDPDDFVRALLRAGAANVIASRWKVDSRATAVYMDGLYHALLAGRSLPVAMREAAATLRRGAATSHPYFWAAFDLFSRELP
jgi:CHAT domain-containing protein